MSKLRKEVDAVFVYKDPDLLYAFSILASGADKVADTYHQPQEFFDNVYQYPKHTKMIIGRTFDNGAPQGVQIAERLHACGFTQLYLISVMDRYSIIDEIAQMPDYLTFIEASDTEGIHFILNE